MALRIREGLNINAKPLQEGPGSLPFIRYLEPKAFEGPDDRPAPEPSAQGLSSNNQKGKVTNSVPSPSPKKVKRTVMSIKELNDKLVAPSAVESVSAEGTASPVAGQPESDTTETQEAPKIIDRMGLPTLEQYMKDDVLFVSIDTEMIQDPGESRYGITEVGMCLLDTRDLRQLSDSGTRGDNAIHLFDAHQFGLYKNQEVADGAEGESLQTRIRSRSWKYIFGKSAIKWISYSRIEREMSSLIYQKLKEEPARKVVFLFFDKTYDLQFLNQADVSLSEEFPNSEVVDTQMVGAAAAVAQILGHPRASANVVYDHLGVPTTVLNKESRAGVFIKQHSAGNDAMFQMQAWVAGLYLKEDDWESLHRGAKLRPEMKRIWRNRKESQADGVSDHLKEDLDTGIQEVEAQIELQQ